MSCINEIVARNLVPGHLEGFILQLFQQTLLLLTSITECGVGTVDRGYVNTLLGKFVMVKTSFVVFCG